MRGPERGTGEFPAAGLIGRILSAIPSRWKFAWRYWRGSTPWDTGVTPPEVMEFISRAEPGTVLDLGCGTGTNALTLARRGWRVTGVDFASKAVREARRKAEAAGLRIDFRAADVADLHMLEGGFDYALDIGCLHSLPETARSGYAAGLSRLVRPGGWFMLYAWLPRWRKGELVGLTPDQVESLLGGDFTKARQSLGEENGHPTAWYWFRRRSNPAESLP